MGGDVTQTADRIEAQRNSRLSAFDLLLLVFILNLAVQPPVDPDFGWHLRTGLDLLENNWQLPATDPYSHTVPEWRWVEHAWLSDVVVGAIYQAWTPYGLLAVMLLYGAISAWTFLWVAETARSGRSARFVAVAAALWVVLPFIGVRTQMLSLLGLGAVWWIWARFRAGRFRTLWACPGVFLLWANLHGGFTAGLLLLGLVLGVSAGLRLIGDSGTSRLAGLRARLRAEALPWASIRHLALVAVVCAGVTLLNPYGWRLHGEIIESLTDQFMLETLHEWQAVSPDTRAGRYFLLYAGALAIAAGWLYRRVEPVRWVVLGAFGILALRHLRNIPLFVLLSVPLWAELLEACLQKALALAPMGREAVKRWQLAVTFALGFFAVVMGSDHLKNVATAGLSPVHYYQASDYPIEAIMWIREHPEQAGARMYNDYGYGGFLLWWLPEKKIFIDGRMPTWREGDRWIFYDYVALTNWDPPSVGVLDKYAVDWGLTARGTALERALRNRPPWKSVYEDRKAVIFVRQSG